MRDEPTTLHIRTSSGRYTIRIAPPRVMVERVDPRAPDATYALSPEGAVLHLRADGPIWDGPWLNTDAITALLHDYETYLERIELLVDAPDEEDEEA